MIDEATRERKGPLLECKFLYTRDLSRECMRHLNRYVNARMRAVMALFALATLAVAVVLLAGGRWFMAAALALLLAVLLYRLFLHDRRVADLRFARNHSAWGGDIGQSIALYDDRLVLRTADASREVPYAQIAYAIETEQLYIFVQGKAGIALYQNGLMEGTQQELRAFLADRIVLRKARGW